MVPRDDKGRFPKGVSGNPSGRKRRQVEDDFMLLLMGAVTREDWIEICIKAVRQARSGDPVARKWLADYLIGSPIQRMEHSGAEGGALDIVVTYVNKPAADSTT